MTRSDAFLNLVTRGTFVMGLVLALGSATRPC
jgi:hypothetical protein